MKVMIDRLLPKWQGLGGKDAYIIVTGHDGINGEVIGTEAKTEAYLAGKGIGK